MKILSIIFYSLLSTGVLAEDAKIPCLKKDGTIGFNNLEKYDCSLINKVVEDPAIKSAHSEKLDSKLAEKLAFKLERNIEEIAILDQYFNQFEFELTKTDEVKRECKLEVMTNPDCGQGKKANKDRLQKLQNSLSAKGNNLFDKLLNTFSKGRGLSNTNKNQCPLEKPSGYYTLNAQFDEASMKNLSEFLEKDDQRGFQEWITTAYDKFPQLKLINRSDKSGNGGFRKEFETYMKAFKSSNMPIKAYVLGFYAKASNQKKLASGLASTCNDIQQNIKKYLCSNVPHLAMPEETANYLFANSEDAEDSVTISNAFSCLKADDRNYLEAQNSVHDLYKDFKSNVVSELPAVGKVVRSTVNDFCSLYNCESPKVKETASCKKGGPVSASDMKKVFDCGGSDGTNCDETIIRSIAYIQSLDLKEKDAENIQFAKILGLDIKEKRQSTKSENNYGHSDFMNNLLGVEGSLRAEGKELTPINVAEKVREFEDKRIEVIPAANKDVILANNADNKVYNLIKNQKSDEALAQQAQSNHNAINTFVNAKDDREEEKKAVIANSISKFSKGTGKSVEKDEFQALKEKDRNDEIRRMRSELESVMKGMNGTEEEKLATIATNNESYSPNKKTASDSTRNLAAEERERLDSYRKSLQSWETRIRDREFDLSEREFRPNSRTSASDDFNKNDKRFDGTQAAADMNANANAGAAAGSNAQALRLSKAATAAGNANGTSENGGEQAAKEVAVDGEAILSIEALATLEKGGLKKLGIAARDSFIIKVRHQEKLFDVPVKSFTYNGKAMFVPLLNSQNRDLAKVILDSPLFADYRQYQQDRSRSVK